MRLQDVFRRKGKIVEVRERYGEISENGLNEPTKSKRVSNCAELPGRYKDYKV